MHVRLAFSVMIQVDADILLIDEVLAVGDAAFQQKCFDEFDRMRDEGKTILFVTHDMGAVQRFCDRAMLLERGRGRRRSASPSEVGDRVPRAQLRRRAPAPTPTERATADRVGDGAREIVEAWFEDEHGRARRRRSPQGGRARSRARVRFDERRRATRSSASCSRTTDSTTVFAASTAGPTPATGHASRPGDEVDVPRHVRQRLRARPLLRDARASRARGGGDRVDRPPRAARVASSSPATRATGGLVDLPHDVALERAARRAERGRAR